MKVTGLVPCENGKNVAVFFDPSRMCKFSSGELVVRTLYSVGRAPSAACLAFVLISSCSPQTRDDGKASWQSVAWLKECL